MPILNLSDNVMFLKKNLADALPDAASQGFIKILDNVYESGAVYKADEVLYASQVGPDAPIVDRYLNFVFQPMLDGNQKVVGIFVEGYDVTEQFLAKMELKSAYESLRESDIRKDEFLAMLAHELRNPLAPISAAAQLLQTGRLDNERVKKTSEVIGRQVNHMTGLIDDLLDVSRVTRGLTELDKVALDIAQVINDAVEQVNPLIRRRKHSLVIRHAPQAGMVYGDKKRLVQIVANVLNNAAKYTPEGGHLELCTIVRDSDVLIEIVDDGIGMTQETARRAFDLFAQAERTSDRSSGGLGLGLSLVKSLISLHGGAVSCKSDGLGKGSTFSISLPLLHDAAPSASDESEAGLPQAVSVVPLHVLVVDDNVDAAEMLKLVLEASGHEVIVEHNAFRALETARLKQPDICLLDIGLPEIDGNELARRLRTQHENRHTALVAVTGYGQENDKANAFEAGFDYHLVKPVDIDKLFSILTKLQTT